jgi:dimeric dUTPase (all-alpha-NTP-PPase superfamily)
MAKRKNKYEHALEDLFRLQAKLNERIGLDTASLRRRFNPQQAGEWLNNYIIAASNELEELRNCTFWKHWCAEAKRGERYRLHDLQNARVEVIDLLFFWISMAQCVGLNARDVYELYLQKLRVNQRRQDNNYSMTGKTESDNKHIRLNREHRTSRPRKRPAKARPRRRNE